MVEERFVLTDEVWIRLAPHLPGKKGDAGATGKDNRLFLDAVALAGQISLRRAGWFCSFSG
jgi:hypothetical protein